ncbi:MAG: hypothetical protein AMXMBFR84_38820 [Candidatus Hydrogenedentota bacterium]
MKPKRLVSIAVLMIALAGSCATQSTLSGLRAACVGPLDQKNPDTHQAVLQHALDKAGPGSVITVAPGTYAMSDPKGLRVYQGMTLILTGATFIWSSDVSEDGQTFLVEDASNVSIEGGRIIGMRSQWDPGVNIAGVRAMGESHDLTIRGLHCEDLSSNAVGVFGASDENPIRSVRIQEVTARNCCNFYGDYLSTDRGPAKGSVREDQGGVAFYFVSNWQVDGCRFERSQSDGTHFYHAHNGQFVNSTVTLSQMGGYFLEGCEDVVAIGNRFHSNGSRGVTIERDSRRCILANNLIAESGREGLWAPDAEQLVVSQNVFKENGIKDDAEKDCHIRIEDTNEYATVPTGVRIDGNLFITAEHQTAAIWAGSGVREVKVNANSFIGEGLPLKLADNARVDVSPSNG